MTEQLTLRGELGEYKVVEVKPFAHGRTSVCYKATAPTGTMVCAKAFHEIPKTAEGDAALAEFQSELRARQRLMHPNILPVIDHGMMPESETPFIIMRLCSGNLRSLMERRDFMPVAELLPILTQIAGALDFAHASGIIHGDIKPENILTEGEGRVYLSDFGVSRFFAFDEPITTLTRAEVGSTAYLSPEQVSDGKQSARSDIYSLAVVAFEAICGSLPFDRRLPTFRQMEAKVSGKHTDPEVLNPAVEASTRQALLRGLSTQPADRPQTALQFCNELSGRVTVPLRDAPHEGGNWWDKLESTHKVAIITVLITALFGLIGTALGIIPDLLGVKR